MKGEDDFRPKIGRVRRPSSPRAKPFLTRVLIAAQKASGPGRGACGVGPSFGRGAVAVHLARQRFTARARRVVVKARVVRQGRRAAPLATHLAYLRRDGVGRDEEPGRTFDRDDADHQAFADRCEPDRHHFRFIVSPEDAAELADLRAFTRDLMAEAEHDLGTRLDWVAVDHWNTAHPHVHILLRGVDQDGQDLMIARDYIGAGLRARAEHLVALELGPRRHDEIERTLTQEVGADRWTGLDRALSAQAGRAGGVVDLRPGLADRDGRRTQSVLIGRMRHLERLGLARSLGVAQWTLSADAEPTLRDLGRRGDIIARIHRGLAAHGRELDVTALDLGEAATTAPVVGRLVAKGLDDELAGSAYAVIDAVDGRTHHVRLGDLAALDEAPVGGVVATQTLPAGGRRPPRAVLRVRSDLSIEAQTTATGATWLDRNLVSREPAELAETGFGAEVRQALERRVDHLASQGLAERLGGQTTFARALLDTLRRRDLKQAAAGLASQSGLAYRPVTEGEAVLGIVRQRLSLASGRFAMIDDGLGFSLVPWSSALDREIGRQVSGMVRAGGRVDWSLGRSRGLER